MYRENTLIKNGSFLVQKRPIVCFVAAKLLFFVTIHKLSAVIFNLRVTNYGSGTVKPHPPLRQRAQKKVVIMQ